MRTETTTGTLLGGRVHYTQFASGFRSGIEPVLLAAALPARNGERVLEGGSGAGAALLCLGWRVSGVCGIGIERDPGLAGLARANAAANALPRTWFVAADVLAMPLRGSFDHACANPPYHPEGGTLSPDPARASAKLGAEGVVANWAASLGAALRDGGTLTLILPPARLAEALAGCARAGCGGVRMLPLWRRMAEPARLMLVRAVRGSRAPLALLAGMALHRADGGLSAETEAILRDGAPLVL
jgi:tRNA1Val (adenine37-N6)-methyltransferase